MAKKPTSKRPSVAGHKVKVSNEPAVAAPAPVGEAGGPAGSSSGGEVPVQGNVPGGGAVQRSQAQAQPAVRPVAQPTQQAQQAPAVSAPVSAGEAEAGAPDAADAKASSKQSVPKNRVVQAKDASSIQHSEVSGKTGTPRMAKKAGKRRVSRTVVIIVAVVLVALAVATSVLAWNQWFRYDDAADIQGTWRVEGSTATFTVSSSDIQLTSDVSYPYTLDTFAKTISFSFGNYEGGGSYVFSPERDVLTITESAPDADGGKAVTTLVKQ